MLRDLVNNDLRSASRDRVISIQRARDVEAANCFDEPAFLPRSARLAEPFRRCLGYAPELLAEVIQYYEAHQAEIDDELRAEEEAAR